MKANRVIVYVSALVQTISWTLFIFVPILGFINEPNKPAGFLTEFILRHLYLILFFYANYSFLIPHVLKRSGVKLYLLYLIPISIFSFLLLVLIENMALEQKHFSFPFKHLVPLIQVYTVGTALRMISDYILENRRKRTLEQEKQTAELAFLRSQINPHFLFNTLNNINALIEENPQAAQTAVVRLSEMMRFMLNTVSLDKISLEKECDYIAAFVSLQRLRLPDNFKLSFEMNIQHPDKQIEPLLLIGFIENTFKHALSGRTDDFIEIHLEEKNGVIKLNTRNSLHPINKSFIKSGVGIINSKKRLDLLYPQQHSLLVNEENTIFEVILTIHL